MMIRYQQASVFFPAAAFLFLSLTSCSSQPIASLEPHRGEVLVLLMGKPGCAGTKEAMRFLTGYQEARPAGVSVVRVDVPPLEGSLGDPGELPEGFPYEVDKTRVIADRLDFFFYPTLYILDRDGEVRFSGGCEPDEVQRIVSELLAEKRGDVKKMYSPSMPAPGERAVSFKGISLDGQRVTLDDLRGPSATFLFFGSTTCPFSRKAAEKIPALAAEFGQKGATVVIIDKSGTREAVKDFYTVKSPGIPVVVDENGGISEKDFGIQVVPFFFLLDAKGLIAYRMPFTEEAARQALLRTLGLSKGPVKIKTKGAG